MDKETIVVPEGMKQKEWFTVKEFREGVGASKTGFNRWLRTHPDFVAKYCQNISNGKQRPRYIIFWKGITAYVNDFAKTRPHSKIEDKLSPILQAKKKTTELANREIERARCQGNEIVQAEQDPILAMLGAISEMRRGQLAIEDRLSGLERMVEETTTIMTAPVATTQGQRKLLNDRVRNYCILHDLPFHIVWRQVHEHVGKPAIHHYEFKHYQAALKYVEKMYNETGLDY